MRIHTWESRSVDWAHSKPAKYLGERTLEEFARDNKYDLPLVACVKGLEEYEQHTVTAYGGAYVKTFSRTEE